LVGRITPFWLIVAALKVMPIFYRNLTRIRGKPPFSL
jgi:hypothetical protein